MNRKDQMIVTATEKESALSWIDSSDFDAAAQLLQVSFPDEQWDREKVETFCMKIRPNEESVAKVCKIGNKLAGIILYSRVNKHNVIEAIAVDPRLRRKGIGRALVEAVVAKYRLVVAHVHERNLEAQFFFRGLGFRVNVDRERFWDGEDCFYPFEHLPRFRMKTK